MLELNIPLWLLVTAAGLPTLLAGGVLYKERRKNGKKTAVPCEPPPGYFVRPETFGIQVHRQLFEQHVDGAFTSVMALLEAERAKLKALMKHSYPSVPTQAATDRSYEGCNTQAGEETHTADKPIGQRVSVLMSQGMAAEQIAHRLGISQTEVSLALKMNGRRSLARSLSC